MATNKYHKAMVERRKAQGLCVECGQTLDRNGTRCVTCRKKINDKEKARRQWYSSHRICPGCGRNDLMGDETVCHECRAQETNSTLKNQNREQYNNYHKNWAKITYQKRKGAGICIRCGKRSATKGETMCAICRNRNNATRRIREWSPGREEHMKKGLCYFCNNPVKTGYKVCEKHYELNVKNAAKGRRTVEAQKYIEEVKRINNLAYMRKDGENESSRTT